MISVGKWEYDIAQEDDDRWIWLLSYDYNDDHMVVSKPFKTFKACQKDSNRHMLKMHEQFMKLIVKAAKEKL